MKITHQEKIWLEVLIVALCVVPVVVLIIFDLPGLGAIAAFFGAGYIWTRARQRKEQRFQPAPVTPLDRNDGHKNAA